MASKNIDNQQQQQPQQQQQQQQDNSGKQDKSDTVKKLYKKDWDKIVKEFEEEEKQQGTGGVDDLFKEIYEKGGEEVRRAMNKSFVESGGTVLSTNWAEVSKDKVDVKPPEGCEYKKWS